MPRYLFALKDLMKTFARARAQQNSMAIPMDRAIRRRLAVEAIATHQNLSDDEVGTAANLVSALSLSNERFSRLLALLHQKLLTGYRARTLNTLFDDYVRMGDRDMLIKLLSKPEDAFWELSQNEHLTPEEQTVVEQSWLSDQNLIQTILANAGSLLNVCSGPLCQPEVCPPELRGDPFERAKLPSSVHIIFPVDLQYHVACLTFPQLIEALSTGNPPINPFTGLPFDQALIDRYALDTKILKASRRLINEFR